MDNRQFNDGRGGASSTNAQPTTHAQRAGHGLMRRTPITTRRMATMNNAKPSTTVHFGDRSMPSILIITGKPRSTATKTTRSVNPVAMK